MVSRVYLYRFDRGTGSFYWVSNHETKGNDLLWCLDWTPPLSQSGLQAAVSHIKTWVIYQEEAQRSPEWCACVSGSVAVRLAPCFLQEKPVLGVLAALSRQESQNQLLFFRMRMSQHWRVRSVLRLWQRLSIAHVPSTETGNVFDAAFCFICTKQEQARSFTLRHWQRRKITGWSMTSRVSLHQTSTTGLLLPVFGQTIVWLQSKQYIFQKAPICEFLERLHGKFSWHLLLQYWWEDNESCVSITLKYAQHLKCHGKHLFGISTSAHRACGSPDGTSRL